MFSGIVEEYATLVALVKGEYTLYLQVFVCE